MVSVLSFIEFLNYCSDVAERAKFYPHGNHGRSNAGIAQGLYFHFALATVHRIQTRGIAWMTTQFRKAWWQLCQDIDQPIYADGIRKRPALCCLPVELPTIMDFWTTLSQRNRSHASDLDDDGADWLLKMDMLVRVEMGGVLPDKVAEGG